MRNAGVAILVVIAICVYTLVLIPSNDPLSEEEGFDTTTTTPSTATPSPSPSPPQGEPDHFWYNTVSKVSQWQEPKKTVWHTDDGKVYYWDPETEKSSWDKPVALSWVKRTAHDGTLYVFFSCIIIFVYYKPISTLNCCY